MPTLFRRSAFASLAVGTLVAALTGAPQAARADFYDLAEDNLQYALPSIRRVLAMYNLEDSPSFLGRSLVSPYIQLDLEFVTYDDGTAPPAMPAPKPTSANAEVTQQAATPAADASADAKPAAGASTGAAAPAQKPASLHTSHALFTSKMKRAPAKPVIPADEAAEEMKEKEKENSGVAAITDAETVNKDDAEKQKVAVQENGEAGGPINSIPLTKVNGEYSKLPRVQVLILQDTALNSIGHWVKDDYIEYCCTKELFDQGIDGCSEVGTLIVKAGYVHKLMSASFEQVEGMQVAHLAGKDAKYDVTMTGEHILIISNCDPRLFNKATKVSGGGIWMNPYGYLPGRLFGFLPFYFAMTLVYAVFTLGWAFLNFRHRKDIAGIQWFISLTLVLTLVEVIAWFCDYYNFNVAGVRHMGAIITAIVITVLRLTVSRMLVVSVSIGYPVVRPSLSLGTKLKIGLLGLVYFACEAALEVVTRYAQTNETAEKWRIFLSIPVAVLNAIFYWWIFTALHDLITYLEQQNQAIKLAMYRTFTHVLAGSLVAAVLFALYQIYFMTTNQLALHWSRLWLLDGGFQLILYTIIFACMSFLWRPSSDSRRYAYAELNSLSGGGPASLDDEEFGEVEMTTSDDHPTNGHHQPITSENAKFTVEEDD